MTAKTPAQRQAELKARRIAAGLVPVSLWAHPDDAPAIKELAAKLARKRAKQAPAAPHPRALTGTGCESPTGVFSTDAKDPT